MENELTKRLKNIEQELIDLKTASLYTSTRNAFSASSGSAYTGLYKITYSNPNNERILSQVYFNRQQSNGEIFARTISGNTQVVELNTTYAAGNAPVTYTTTFYVVSNVPVTSIVRL